MADTKTIPAEPMEAPVEALENLNHNKGDDENE